MFFILIDWLRLKKRNYLKEKLLFTVTNVTLSFEQVNTWPFYMRQKHKNANMLNKIYHWDTYFFLNSCFFLPRIIYAVLPSLLIKTDFLLSSDFSMQRMFTDLRFNVSVVCNLLSVPTFITDLRFNVSVVCNL